VSAAAQSEMLSSENCLKVRRIAAQIPRARSPVGESGPAEGGTVSPTSCASEPVRVVAAAATSKSSAPCALASAASGESAAPAVVVFDLS